MCQSRANGGRRCAAHMAATRGMRSLLTMSTGLETGQINSTLNSLRAEGRGRPEPTAQQYATFLNRQFRTIDALDTTVEERQRLRRIFTNASGENLPDGPTYYAYTRLTSATRTQARALRSELSNLATRMGVTRATATNQFWNYYSSPASTIEAPSGYEPQEAVSAISRGLPGDPNTSRAYEALHRSANSSADNPNIATTRRVTRRNVDSSFITEMGYDHEDGRLEVVFRSMPDQVYAYRGVPQSVWESMSAPGASVGRVYSRTIRHNAEYAYDSRDDAESDAYARRCAHCGQFRAVSHSCPQSYGEIEEPRVAEPTLSEPSAPEESSLYEGEDWERELSLGSDNTITDDERDAAVEAQIAREVAEREQAEAQATEFMNDFYRRSLEAASARPEEERDDWERELLAHPEQYLTPAAPAGVSDEEQARLDAREVADMGRITPEPMSEEDWNAMAPWEQEILIDAMPVSLREQHEQARLYLTSQEAQNLATSINQVMTEIFPYYDANSARNRQDVAEIVAGTANSASDNIVFENLDENYDENGQSREEAAARNPRLAATLNSPRVEELDVTAQASTSDSEAVAAPTPTRRRRNAAAASEPRLTAAQRRYLVPFEERERADLANQNMRHLANVGDSEEERAALHMDYSGSLDIQSPTRLRAAVNRGQVANVAMNVRVSGRYVPNENGNGRRYEYGYSTRVPVAVYRDGEEWKVRSNGDPRCSCEVYVRNGRCRHTENYSDSERLSGFGSHLFRRCDPSAAAVADAVSSNTTGEPVVTNVPNATRSNRAGRVLGAEVQTVPTRWGRPNTRFGDLPEDVSGFTHALNNGYHPTTRNYEYEDDITVPTSANIRAALRVGHADIPITWSGSRSDLSDGLENHNGSFRVSGTVRLAQENNNVSLVSRNLRCTCSVYRRNSHCVHVDYVSNQAPRFGARGSTRTNAEIGQLNSMAEVMAERARERDWGTHQERLDEQIARHATSSPQDSYTRNPGEFLSDVSHAKAEKAAGRSALVFSTAPVTEGVCAPGGRKFGVELEFDFSDEMSYSDRANALRAIGQEMHEAGLTTTPDQQGYHSAARNGYSTWSFEHDSTVSGEIVSPIMHDTPEHWAQMAQVCDIIKRHGGVATERTGSHVHVSTGTYGNSVEKHAELANIVNQHEDTIYRLASNPERGTHRPMRWCAPNTEFDSTSVDSARRSARGGTPYMGALGNGHHLGLNFQSASGANVERDNVEFRQWDGTLDPAAIQAQVMMSAAIVDAAERTVESRGMTHIMRENVGSHKTRRAALRGGRVRSLTHEEEIADTATTRSFIDTLFSTREAKKRIAALYAVTQWQNG